jgi:hypothetical protein
LLLADRQVLGIRVTADKQQLTIQGMKPAGRGFNGYVHS